MSKSIESTFHSLIADNLLAKIQPDVPPPMMMKSNTLFRKSSSSFLLLVAFENRSALTEDRRSTLVQYWKDIIKYNNVTIIYGFCFELLSDGLRAGLCPRFNLLNNMYILH